MATVKYQIGTYSGTVKVHCDPDDDNETIIARAKAKIRREYGSIGMAYENYKVIDRD